MSIKTVKVDIKAQESKTYPIIIGENLLTEAGKMIKNQCKANKYLIVTDENVYNLYFDKLKNSFLNEEIDFIVLKAGEKTKNIENLTKIWKKALAIKLERKDAIIAFGGGVIGDLTGFAASTYLRGINFIQIPTTLLSQVDSSVGGKVAINLEEGKNLIGAFYQPSIVISDTSTLTTLPVAELKTGLAEVIKYAFIEKTCNGGEFLDLFKYLIQNRDNIFEYNQEVLKTIVEYSCLLKAAVVAQDEKESGLRAILNLGHTIGHAIEKCTNYETFTHGQAVAMGMKSIFYIAKESKLIDEAYYQSALKLIADYNLDEKISKTITKQDLISAMSGDKKVEDGKVRFVIPTCVGEVEILNNIDVDILNASLDLLY